MPQTPCSSSATSSARSPRATPSATLAPERHGLLAREAVHEAERRAVGDAVEQHVGEAAELRLRQPGDAADRGCVVIAGLRRRAHHDRVARRRRRRVVEHDRPVELHRQAVARLEVVPRRRRRSTVIEPSSTHTCWWPAARRGPVSKATRAPAGSGRRPAGARPASRPARRSGARSRRPGRPTPVAGRGGPPVGDGSAPASNSEPSVTSRPTASFSSTTAVGLASPRSTSEIIERLTPLRAASASSERPRSARRSRTRAAIRSCSASVGSDMVEEPSMMVEGTSSAQLLARRARGRHDGRYVRTGPLEDPCR